MGLRDKAAQFRWGTNNIDLDHLEENYADKVLSKGELLAIKSQIKSKIDSVHNILDRKLIDMQTLLEISSEINSTLNIKDLLQIIIFTFMGHFQISDVAIFKIEDARALIIGKQGFNTLKDIDLSINFMTFLNEGDNLNQIYSLDQFKLLAETLKGISISGFIPLKGKDGIFGLIFLGNKYDNSEFSDQEKDFSITLSSLAGIALENASLYERLDSKYQELSALYDVSKVINSSSDFELVLSLVMETITTGFGISQAILLINDNESYIIKQQTGLGDEILEQTISLSQDEMDILKDNQVIHMSINTQLQDLCQNNQNALWVPLNSIDTNAGALLIFRSENYILSNGNDNLISLFSIISSQMAPPILMTKLLKDNQENILDPFHPVIQKIIDEAKKASQYNIDITFAMLTLQNLKEYQKNHGYKTAYDRLEDFSSKLMSQLPPNSNMIRYTSQKFLLFLPAIPETDLEDLKAGITRLCETEFSKEQISLNPQILTVTYPQDCDDHYAILSRIE